MGGLDRAAVEAAVSVHTEGATVALRVSPRSSVAGLTGRRGDALKLAVQAAPVEGAANEEVLDRIAEACGVGRDMVSLLTGVRGRDKTVLVRRPPIAVRAMLLRAARR